MLTITPIVYNINISELDVDRNQVVWKELEGSFQDTEIFFYDGTKVIQLSNNQTDEDYAPKLSNGQVVWYSYNGSDAEIFFYDGTKTSQLTDNSANDESPQILNGQVLWYQYQAITDTEDPTDSQSEIFLYDGENTIQITDNTLNDRNAQFYGRQVVWEGLDPGEQGGDYEIFLYNNGQTQKLTDNQTSDTLEVVKGNYAIWASYDRKENDRELYLYDGSKTIRLTNNTTDDFVSDTDGQNVVWLNNNEVFLYDGNTIQQITYDGTSKNSVQVSGNNIVWSAYNYAYYYYDTISYGYDSEVFLYNGSTIAQITNNDLNESNLQIDGQNIVWEVENYDFNSYVYNSDIYIYRNGAVSPLANTAQNERIISLSGNNLIGSIDAPYSYDSISLSGNNAARISIDNPYIYDSTVDQVFLASWTDQTFPILENPEQYGASHPDLIRAYGYNLDAFNQHYRQNGIAEGRSLDTFDEFAYLASNIDVLAAYGSSSKTAAEHAAEHYIRSGNREERSFDKFDALQYIASYDDLIYQYGGGGSYYPYYPEYHSYSESDSLFPEYLYPSYSEPDLAGATRQYVEFGYDEERPIDTFDEISYLAANSDLIEVFGENLDLEGVTKHYVQTGFFEYFRLRTFDAANYLAANTDLIDQIDSDRTTAALHFIFDGYTEGRQLYGDFNALQYIASYKDVFEKVGFDERAALDHFVDRGYREKREKDSFNEYDYLASNSDLIDDFSYYSYYVDTLNTTYHYLTSGIPEGRPIDTFDPVAYYGANPDVARAYNGDLTQASKHYVQFGFFESRPTEPGLFEATASIFDYGPIIQLPELTPTLT